MFSDVVAHPPQCLICFAFRVLLFLLTKLVQSAYLSYCGHPVNLNQSGHSHLISLINSY